jgi:hypothetical protein
MRFFCHWDSLLDDLLYRVLDGFGRSALDFDFQFDFWFLRLLDSHVVLLVVGAIRDHAEEII